MAVTLESVVKQLTDSGIIAPGKLDAFVPPKATPKDGEELLRQLLHQNLLTKFQAQQCAAGRGKALILGNYIILDKIGAGGMGQVFKAEHRRMKRMVAIKMLPKALLSDAAAAARFQREVEAAAKLSHSNIVAAYDADEANGVHFLVMEYVEGSDLAALVKKSGPLPVAKALQCILQAARGLEYAHAQGVTHRDIKPANLLLDKSGRIKILDMGLARLDAPGAAGPASAPQMELTGTGAVMGTVDYMAPEQALNTKRADARSDVYSLGCTLYYLLSGQQIYGGESVVEKLVAHREQPIPSLAAVQAGVPKAVEAVFRRMVAKKPDERYQTMSEVVAAIQGCSKQQAIPTAQALPDTKPAAAAVTALAASPAADEVTAIDVEPLRTTSRQTARKKPARGKAKSSGNTLLYGLAGAAALGVILLAGVFFMTRGHDDRLVVKPDQPEGVVPVPHAQGEVQPHSARLNDPAFEQWTKDVAALPPDKQLEAVSRRLQDLNPGFDGRLTDADGHGTPKIDTGIVTELGFRTDNVIDISPVQALAGLKCLKCSGAYSKPTKFSNLRPLQGMKLTKLDCSSTAVSDLSPLRGMALASLSLEETQANDLSPLQGLPLTTMNCFSAPITDLSPLKSVTTLTALDLRRTKVTEDGVAALHAALPNCRIHWPHQGDIYGQPAKANDIGRTFSDPSVQQPAAPLATGAAPGQSPKHLVAPFDVSAAKAGQVAWANHLRMQVEMTNRVGMKMILIPPGEFLMGSTDEQVAIALKAGDDMKADQGVKDRIPRAERPQHRVAIAKPFLLGETEVTVGQFRKFVDASKYATEAEQYGFGHSSEKDISRAKDDAKGKNWRTPGYAVSDELPVTQVTWNDAASFCNWLSERESLKPCYRRDGDTWFVAAGDGYRLPTEAEWEYACRAGTTTQYSFGDDWRELQQYGWFNQNSSGRPPAVALKLANPFGLYDMHGNLGEWCQDYYDEHWYSKATPDDLAGQPGGSTRVNRGGNWYDNASHCRSASRYNLAPAFRLGNCGFRVASPVYVAAPEATTGAIAGSNGSAVSAPLEPARTMASNAAPVPPTNGAAAPAQASGAGRLARPTPAARQAALEKLKAAYHDAWADATDNVHRNKLIKQLLQLAGPSSPADDRFACYEGAVQLACDGGDLSRALTVIVEWSTVFDIDAPAASSKAIDDVINAAKTPAQRKDLGIALVPVMDEQMAADRYDVADLVLNAAAPLVGKVRDPAMTKEYKLRETEMQQWLKLWSAAHDARATLAENPNDAAAQLALGRYFCLARHDWQQGLTHLRQGSDELLAAAAKAELTVPVNADAQAELGDMWWKIGEKEKGSAFPKLAWQEHGMTWIRKSLPRLPAAAKNRLKSRMSQLAQQRKTAGTVFTVRRPLDVEATLGGHWYKFYHTLTSWPEAKARCEALGGHLVFVETGEENEFVKSLVVRETQGEKDFSTWMGATDKEEEGKFVWLDGNPVTFTDWGTGQGKVENEPYLSYWNGGDSSLPSMKWGDAPEYTRAYFVCEWDQ